VVDDGEYGILAFAERKACDQVHCDLLEGESALFCRDSIKGGFLFVGENLILLTGSTSLNIVCDPTVHSVP
jgi:hypothetical protein